MRTKPNKEAIKINVNKTFSPIISSVTLKNIYQQVKPKNNLMSALSVKIQNKSKLTGLTARAESCIRTRFWIFTAFIMSSKLMTETSSSFSDNRSLDRDSSPEATTLTTTFTDKHIIITDISLSRIRMLMHKMKKKI